MAEAESDTDDARCRALTASGARCSRTAGADGFCYQHDDADPTVDADAPDDGGSAEERTEGDDTMSTKEAEADDEEESTTETETESNEGGESNADTSEQPVADVEDTADADAEAAETDPVDDGADADAASVADESEADTGADLWDARETAERVANELIDDPFDGIIEITRAEEGGGWTGVVEVIERSAIPDTQDILGRYEVSIGPNGDLEGYRLTGRYRRGDVSDEQAPGQ